MRKMTAPQQTWDRQEEFDALLHQISASKDKISAVRKMAMQNTKNYKFVVHSIEKFARKCPDTKRLPLFYAIDAICQASKRELGEKDVYTPRFARNIETLFAKLIDCPAPDRERIGRTLGLWKEREWFTPEILANLSNLIKEENERTERDDASTPVPSSFGMLCVAVLLDCFVD